MNALRWRSRLLLLCLVTLPFVLLIPASSQEDISIRVLFMHHSTGLGLIEQGGLREGLAEYALELWDHGYNGEGLTDGSGEHLGINWEVPDDNTDPIGWFNIFNQDVTEPPENTLSHMLDFPVILFKSCFPSSNIESDEQFEEYRDYFLSIRDVIDQYPDHLFIPFTTPPLVPNETSPEAAARAREWASYLTSDEYTEDRPNIAVFDFFSALADENGYLREEYRADEWDSHPNEIANQEVAALLVEFVVSVVEKFDFEGGAGIIQANVILEDIS